MNSLAFDYGVKVAGTLGFSDVLPLMLPSVGGLTTNYLGDLQEHLARNAPINEDLRKKLVDYAATKGYKQKASTRGEYSASPSENSYSVGSRWEPSSFAHEMGHMAAGAPNAHWLSRKALSLGSGNPGFSAETGMLLGGLGASKDVIFGGKELHPAIPIGITAASHLPRLIAEADASIRAHKLLKSLGEDSAKHNVANAAAFGTYLSNMLANSSAAYIPYVLKRRLIQNTPTSNTGRLANNFVTRLFGGKV